MTDSELGQIETPGQLHIFSTGVCPNIWLAERGCSQVNYRTTIPLRSLEVPFWSSSSQTIPDIFLRPHSSDQLEVEKHCSVPIKSGAVVVVALTRAREDGDGFVGWWLGGWARIPILLPLAHLPTAAIRGRWGLFW